MVREYTIFDFNVMPVTWIVNGSDVVPSYHKWEGDDLYVTVGIENYREPITDLRRHTEIFDLNVNGSKNIKLTLGRLENDA